MSKKSKQTHIRKYRLKLTYYIYKHKLKFNIYFVSIIIIHKTNL